tara:strand:+ start:1579 stop:1965 length:387 start_codon:yes stop_codon:yes gene_type:complete
MRLILLLSIFSWAQAVAGQGPVTIEIPPKGSWLLTGGGPGQDDIPAPFLPAIALIQTAESGGVVRVMDDQNEEILSLLRVSENTLCSVEIYDGQRLLVDAGEEGARVTVTYVPPGADVPRGPLPYIRD